MREYRHCISCGNRCVNEYCWGHSPHRKEYQKQYYEKNRTYLLKKKMDVYEAKQKKAKQEKAEQEKAGQER